LLFLEELAHPLKLLHHDLLLFCDYIIDGLFLFSLFWDHFLLFAASIELLILVFSFVLPFLKLLVHYGFLERYDRVTNLDLHSRGEIILQILYASFKMNLAASREDILALAVDKELNARI